MRKIKEFVKLYTEYRKRGYPNSVPKFLEWVENLGNKIYAWKTIGGYVYKLQRQNNEKYCWVGLENAEQIWGGKEYNSIIEALHDHVGSGISRLKEFDNYDQFIEWAKSGREQRELKFRAWDKKNKMWCGEHLAITIDGKKMYWSDSGEEVNKEKLDIVLMAYTGLQDKNGKEIYEGDIVEDPKLGKAEIRFLNASFVVWAKGTQHWVLGQKRAFNSKVIGNIYENPELLTNQSKKTYEKRKEKK